MGPYQGRDAMVQIFIVSVLSLYYSNHFYYCSILEHVTGCTSLTSANVVLSAKQVVSSEKELIQKWKVRS